MASGDDGRGRAAVAAAGGRGVGEDDVATHGDDDALVSHEASSAVWAFAGGGGAGERPGARVLAYGDSLTAGYHRDGAAFW